MALTEAQELLEMMEHVLAKDGRALALHQPDFASYEKSLVTTAFSTSNITFPVSLAVFPHVDLNQQLRDDERDVRARLVAKMLDKSTVDAANGILDGEHDQVEARWQATGYGTLALREKLVALRSAQAQARAASTNDLTVTAITGVNGSNGLPLGSQTYHLPTNVSWSGLQSALANMTSGSPTREAGYAHGYSLSHGTWLYQLSSDLPTKTVRKLATEIDYEVMRKRIVKGEEKGVIIWHELLWRASRRTREELDAERRADRTRHDWISENGWQAWEPFLDLDCRGEFDTDLAEEARAPSVEPLSDTERATPVAADGKRKRKQDDGVQQRTPKKAKSQPEMETKTGTPSARKPYGDLKILQWTPGSTRSTRSQTGIENDSATGPVRKRQGHGESTPRTPRASKPQTRSATKANSSKGRRGV